MPPYDGRVSGRAVCPIRRGVASSEAEVSRLLEGRFATLERGGDHPAGPRGVRMGRVLGFFESLSFFQIGNEAMGLRGLSCLICVCVFRVVLVPRLGYP